MSLVRRLRGSPAGFLAVNAVILLVLYFGLVEPIRVLLAEGEAGLAERRETLARYQAVTAQATAIADYAKRVTQDNELGEFLAGDNDGLVAANLQARLKAAADEAKVNVRSLQMLPSKTLDSATLTGARLDVTGPLPAIHALARALEGPIPLLLVTDASLRRENSVWGSQEEKELIAAQFDVFGAAKPQAAGASPQP
jgi:hypothetical protein